MKHKVFNHFIAVTILLLSSVALLSSWMSSRLDDYIVLYIIFATVAVAVGYARPFLPFWLRWLTLMVIFLTVCMVTDGNEWGIVWMAMLQCLFAMAIVLRRIAMEQSNDTTTASRSVFRALYDLMEDKYKGVAVKLDEMLGRDNTVLLSPVAHAVSILSLSLIFFVISIGGSEMDIEEYGFFVVAGLAVGVTLFYTLKATAKSKGFFKHLVSALAMFVMGFVAMVICSMMAIMAIISITTLFNAISNLFKKLFS